MTTTTLALALVAIALPCVAFGEQASKTGAPNLRFEDYRVEIIPPIAGRSREAIVDKEAGTSVIRQVAKEGPDFAGRYAIVKWTCGSGCTSAVIVNVKTGKIYEPPFLGVSRCESNLDSPVLSYRVNSSLLIVKGSLEIPDKNNSTFTDGSCGTFFYIWTGSRLNLIRSVLAEAQGRR